MRIVSVRRICQVFFLILFLWFCVVMNLGERWWQLRGWPVNWLLELDPLVGLGTLLTTRTVYKGLIWGLVTIVLTIFLGRFFCGWICPFGTVHQFVGFLGHRKKSVAAMADRNRYRKAQSFKYWILTVLLAGAFTDIAGMILALPQTDPMVFWTLICLGLLALALLGGAKLIPNLKRRFGFILVCVAVWFVLGKTFGTGVLTGASLQTGLLDPIPLFHRSVNLVLLPLADESVRVLSSHTRFAAGAWLVGVVFFSAIFLNLFIPRFYCRFVCPLGALFGVLSVTPLWRIGKSREECRDCHLCERHCEGGCEPSSHIRIPECVLCMNCLDECRHSLIGYRTEPSATGERSLPDVSRRGFVLSLFSGLAAIPIIRLDGSAQAGWNPHLVRPPGSLAETDFLHRCVKCGQCMRICPTNVIQPAGVSHGTEALWTPALDFRVGTSGCQLNCIACGHVCPTAAIRSISFEEKLGLGEYAAKGPIRIGTAFMDRGRCLPWAMDIPCIVCQENCPVSPKAIYTRVAFSPVLTPALTVNRAEAFHVQFESGKIVPDRFGTGDFFVRTSGTADTEIRQILTNSDRDITVLNDKPFDPIPRRGDRVDILIRLQRPYVDPKRCIGCGICQHECPVKGKRAIRVTADNETRSREHSLILTES